MKRTDAATAVVGHDYRMHKLPLRMVPWRLYLELAPAFRLKVGGELPHKKSLVAPRRVREGYSTVTLFGIRDSYNPERCNVSKFLQGFCCFVLF